MKKRYTRDTKLELISHNISIVDFEYKEGRMEERKIDSPDLMNQDNQILLFNAFEYTEIFINNRPSPDCTYIEIIYILIHQSGLLVY